MDHESNPDMPLPADGKIIFFKTKNDVINFMHNHFPRTLWKQIADAVRNCPGYQGEPPISMYESFDAAVLAAHSMAQPGDVVILSPACASFDHFKNFAQRGEAFKKIIYEL